MNLWIFYYEIDYEGANLLGIYTTEEAAKQARSQMLEEEKYLKATHLQIKMVEANTPLDLYL